MKTYFVLSVIACIQLSCSTRTKVYPFNYLKIVVFDDADSITVENKGVGVGDYLYYDLQKDSIAYRLGGVTGNPKMYLGYLRNRLYRDTLSNLIKVIKRYPNGYLPDTMKAGTIYCGPTLYAEFRDSNGLHHYYLTMDFNDTVNNFCEFFFRFEDLPWEKTLVDNTILNEDSLAIATAKAIGVYDSLPTPYIGKPCEKEIDKSKIFGRWRTISNKYQLDGSSYDLLVLIKDGSWYLEPVAKGISKGKKAGGTFILSQKSNTITFNTTGHGAATFIILKLTGNCLEYKRSPESNPTRYDRL